jgi:hypothetical protein
MRHVVELEARVVERLLPGVTVEKVTTRAEPARLTYVYSAMKRIVTASVGRQSTSPRKI